MWLRWLAALLGAGATATAATLAAVFLGFGLGNLAGARIVARLRRPLAAYGAVELLAALAAAAVPTLAARVEPLIPWLRQGSVFGATVAAMLVVLPAAIGAGATLPALAPSFGPRGAAAAYAANTVGAFLGALVLPFWLLPHGTMHRSVYVLAAIGAAVGVVALLLARRGDRPATIAPARVTAELADDPLPTRALAFASGVLLIGLEFAFTRLFAQIHESSLQAFALVVAAFLLALALGTGVARLLLGWMANARTDGDGRRRALALLWPVAGLLVAAVPRLFFALSDGLRVSEPGEGDRLARLAGIAAATLIVPVAAAGSALPLLLQAPRTAPWSPRALGRLLAWNTAGSVVGPLLLGFVLLPALGSGATFPLLGAVLAAAGAGLARGRGRLLGGALALGAAALAAAAPPAVRIDPTQDETLVELREGSQGVVAVLADRHEAAIKKIKVDNHYVLGGTLSTGDERQLGHLPLLLHPAPHRVAFLGLGTAITAGAAVLHPVDEIAAVELLPEVVDVARRHFRDANLGVLDDTRTHLVVDDARAFLRGVHGRYDVVVGDLVVPWRAGESALYTREHFARARAALAEGGLFCQWLPAYQLSAAQFDAIAATFLEVFPRATLWRGDFVASLPTLGLVGHTADVDPDVVAARVRDLAPRRGPASPYLADPSGAWLYLIGALDPALPRFQSARRHTFDAPWLELAGPRTAAESLTGAALDALLEPVLATPVAGTPLAKLRADELRWRAAGADLFRASELVFRGDSAAARDLGRRTLEGLPEALRASITGGR